jgi:hypothetical protein
MRTSVSVPPCCLNDVSTRNGYTAPLTVPPSMFSVQVGPLQPAGMLEYVMVPVPSEFSLTVTLSRSPGA